MPSTAPQVVTGSALLATALQQFAAMLLPIIPEAGKFPTTIAGLSLTRWNEAGQNDVCFFAPAVGIIVQGRKESLIGGSVLRYGAGDCLVNGVDMPSQSRIVGATPQEPLLAVSLGIDKSLAVELAAAMAPDFPSAAVPRLISDAATASPHAGLGISLATVTADVLDAFVRLVDLLNKPTQRELMAPLLIKEILCRVLMGPQGIALRMIHAQGSHSCQVGEAISWLRANYRKPLNIDTLAGQVGMATSTFHRQFKKMTALSPLQFQKYLRLYEAQRLMLSEDMDAGQAGHSVGYDSMQQFNREYKRMFGEPPRRDTQRLRRA